MEIRPSQLCVQTGGQQEWKPTKLCLWNNGEYTGQERTSSPYRCTTLTRKHEAIDWTVFPTSGATQNGRKKLWTCLGSPETFFPFCPPVTGWRLCSDATTKMGSGIDLQSFLR